MGLGVTPGSGATVATRVNGAAEHQQEILQGAPSGSQLNTRVADTTTSGQIVAANANRVGLIIYNDSTAILRLTFVTAATVTTTAFSIEVPNDSWIAFPGDFGFNWKGQIMGVWDADTASGGAQVTEFTAS